MGTRDSDPFWDQNQPASTSGSEGPLPSLVPFRLRRIRLVATAIGAVFFLIVFSIDWLLINAHLVSQAVAALILDGAFALVVSVLLYKVLAYDRERRIKVVERLETIHQMNHHIRNALQVISFNAQERTSRDGLEEIDRAMNRIQWALREILPKVEPEFKSFEGSARQSQDSRLKKTTSSDD